MLAALLATAACSRQVTLQATPAAATEVSLKVTNTATQAVTVYVLASGTEYTLRSVAPNATELIPVPGVAAGSTVRLRAMLADGSRSYTRENVVLSGVFEWQVP
jgi:P pilus assembly chaperone PapD